MLAVHDLEDAADVYTRMGFQMGARNRHPWGTENRLIQFRSSFLELITVADAGQIPPHAHGFFSFGAFVEDYLTKREGLAMFALDSSDAAADAAQFARAGIAEFQPFSFERTGHQPDGTQTRVAFSLAFAHDDRLPDAAFFVCQQHHPEAFWNPLLQRHPNGANLTAAVTLDVESPEDHAGFRMFGTRGLYFALTDRRPEAAAYYRESARLADQAGDTLRLGSALLSLSDILGRVDPGAAAETARIAAGHLRRAGNRDGLAVAAANLAEALLMLGGWDTAEAELTQATDSGALGDFEFVTCQQGWLAALRGDTDLAQAVLDGLKELRVSEDPQSRGLVSMVEGFTAAVHDLREEAGVGELLALLDSYQPGHLTPMLRAERDLVRARLAASADDPAAFAAAIISLREQSTPYHLAHGLLDHAQFLARLREAQAAEAAIGQARDIARHLRCQLLLDRAARITSAKSPVQV